MSSRYLIRCAYYQFTTTKLTSVVGDRWSTSSTYLNCRRRGRDIFNGAITTSFIFSLSLFAIARPQCSLDR